MKAIVAVDLDYGIGINGDMLFPIPEDLKYFKEKTLNKVVVMGRKTFEALPNQSPLCNRTNIVITRDKSFKDDRLVICNSIEETLETLKNYNEEEIFIIGGGVIYERFLPYCNEIYLTKIYKKHKADTVFPNIEENEEFKLVSSSEDKEYNGVKFKFMKFERVKNFSTKNFSTKN